MEKEVCVCVCVCVCVGKMHEWNYASSFVNINFPVSKCLISN